LEFLVIRNDYISFWESPCLANVLEGVKLYGRTQVHRGHAGNDAGVPPLAVAYIRLPLSSFRFPLSTYRNAGILFSHFCTKGRA
jgi:hypothetical protein